MLTKTLSVSALQTGTVIDHIPAGLALKIIDVLQLSKQNKTLSVGINLNSPSLGKKDIIKIHDKELSILEAKQVAIFAPRASITIIKDYEIADKFTVDIPETLSGALSCPNPKCISNHEGMMTLFSIDRYRQQIFLNCHYC